MLGPHHDSSPLTGTGANAEVIGPYAEKNAWPHHPQCATGRAEHSVTISGRRSEIMTPILGERAILGGDPHSRSSEAKVPIRPSASQLTDPEFDSLSSRHPLEASHNTRSNKMQPREPVMYRVCFSTVFTLTMQNNSVGIL